MTYTFDKAGKHTIKITSELNGFETEGYTVEVEIEEETLKEENLIGKQEKKDNKGIYAIAGVAAIVVIGGVIAIVKSKKK